MQGTNLRERLLAEGMESPFLRVRTQDAALLRFVPLLAFSAVIGCSSASDAEGAARAKTAVVGDSDPVATVECYDCTNSAIQPETMVTDVERSCGLDEDNVVDTGDSAFALIGESDRQNLTIFRCLVSRRSYTLPLEAIRRAVSDGDASAAGRMADIMRQGIIQQESPGVRLQIDESLRRAMTPIDQAN